MRMQLKAARNNQMKSFMSHCYVVVCLVFFCLALPAYAQVTHQSQKEKLTVLNQQITLLQNRYQQSKNEFEKLQKVDANVALADIERIGVSMLDKLQLDISVAESNLQSIEIELADAKRTLNWSYKNIQEINNQLNVLSVFGNRIIKNDTVRIERLHTDLTNQQALQSLQEKRVKFLTKLRNNKSSILQLRQDRYKKLNTQIKSQRMMRLKQQQASDELAYQRKQNEWLGQIDLLYAALEKLDPTKDKKKYSKIERDIFIANEKANHAYVLSLLARYNDQAEQLDSITLKNNSITQLHEISEQLTELNTQLKRLDDLVHDRVDVLQRELKLSKDKNSMLVYTADGLSNIRQLINYYQATYKKINRINDRLASFRVTVDKALQVELSSRQGLPALGVKALLDIGKELLLVPALTFQVLKSLGANVVSSLKSASIVQWLLFILGQIVFAALFISVRKFVKAMLVKPTEWKDKINTKWLALKWFERNYIELCVFVNVLGSFVYFLVPLKNYVMFVYAACAWLIFKGILTIARAVLVETASSASGDDVRLYTRLKWSILVGGSLVTASIFVYQLPLIYELKTLADRMFLLFMMVFSFLLLSYWKVIPTLILSHMERRHPYLEKSISLLGLIIPLLLFSNAVIGLVGYVNLVMTISWYEGVFLVVLVCYLFVRGLLSDAVEQLSNLVIQYSKNGWLMTEAFLKPLDRILRIALFFLAGGALFLLYGWNKQSPIVERLNAILHYELVKVLNSSITTMSIIELVVVISVLYWTAKWTREFVFRMLAKRTRDMGIRNTMAIMSQYFVVLTGIFICLQVLGIDLRALAVVAGMFAFGVGLGLRDLANNFFCGFLILIERPVRVGDIIRVNDAEGEVVNIGSRAIVVQTWDHMELFIPNSEIFNRSFTNLTARDNVVRCVLHIKIDRTDSPHQVKNLLKDLIGKNESILTDPAPHVLLKEMTDVLLVYELRYYVNLKQVKSRTIVASDLLTSIWDAFKLHGIKPPYQQRKIHLHMHSGEEKRVIDRLNLHAEELLEEPELT